MHPKKSSTDFAPLPGPQPHSGAQFSLDVTPMQSLAPVRGQTFRNQLSDLANGHRTGVLMSTTVPVRYSNPSRTALSKSADFGVNTAYTRVTHASTTDHTEWTQGMMMPANGTEWASILPQDLTMDKASGTNRVIKSIMGHTTKPIDFPGITTKPGVNVMMKPLVTPATLSFVEDVTGELATATKHTGSAVRASYLYGKLKMKNDGATTMTGFRDAVMGTVSQLNSGGAVALARKISNERTSSLDGKTSATATNYASDISAIHNHLDHEIGRRFDDKHAKYMAIKGDPVKVRKELGKWWAAADRSDKASSLTNYGNNKYAKHGIK